jgi:hypothetical protein
MTSHLDKSNEEREFGEFRRKVKSLEVLSASVERLLLSLRFTGELTLNIENGRVKKSRYEEWHYGQKYSGVEQGLAQKL